MQSTGRSDETTSAVGSVPVLYGASPNPINPLDPATHIAYWVPRKEHVRISLYDVAGRRIVTLVDDVQNRGDHSVQWRGEDLPNGMYLCRLEVGDFTQTRKLMFLN